MCIEWVKCLALSGLAGTQGGSLPAVVPSAIVALLMWRTGRLPDF